jgi:hypothetical protein
MSPQVSSDAGQTSADFSGKLRVLYEIEARSFHQPYLVSLNLMEMYVVPCCDNHREYF